MFKIAKSQPPWNVWFTVTCSLTVGHGRSEGVRVDICSFTDYTNDVIQHVDMVKGKYPDCPVFLFGHSMVSSDLVQQMDDVLLVTRLSNNVRNLIVLSQWIVISLYIYYI